MKQILAVVVLAAIVNFAGLAAAATPTPKPTVICLTTSGQLQSKTKCARGETLLNLSSLKKAISTTTISQKGDTGAIGPRGEKGETGTQGLKGDQGIPGLKGEKGDTGLAGQNGLTGSPGTDGQDGSDFFSTIPSSKSVRGAFSVVSPSVAVISLPAPAPAPIQPSDVLVAWTPAILNDQVCRDYPNLCFTAQQLLKDRTVCQGSVALPTAPPGKVCIYPTGRGNPIEGLSFSTDASANIYGFKISGQGLEATWAYTAP